MDVVRAKFVLLLMHASSKENVSKNNTKPFMIFTSLENVLSKFICFFKEIKKHCVSFHIMVYLRDYNFNKPLNDINNFISNLYNWNCYSVRAFLLSQSML